MLDIGDIGGWTGVAVTILFGVVGVLFLLWPSYRTDRERLRDFNLVVRLLRDGLGSIDAMHTWLLNSDEDPFVFDIQVHLCQISAETNRRALAANLAARFAAFYQWKAAHHGYLRTLYSPSLAQAHLLSVVDSIDRLIKQPWEMVDTEVRIAPESLRASHPGFPVGDGKNVLLLTGAFWEQALQKRPPSEQDLLRAFLDMIDVDVLDAYPSERLYSGRASPFVSDLATWQASLVRSSARQSLRRLYQRLVSRFHVAQPRSRFDITRYYHYPSEAARARVQVPFYRDGQQGKHALAVARHLVSSVNLDRFGGAGRSSADDKASPDFENVYWRKVIDVFGWKGTVWGTAGALYGTGAGLEGDIDSYWRIFSDRAHSRGFDTMLFLIVVAEHHRNRCTCHWDSPVWRDSAPVQVFHKWIHDKDLDGIARWIVLLYKQYPWTSFFRWLRLLDDLHVWDKRWSLPHLVSSARIIEMAAGRQAKDLNQSQSADLERVKKMADTCDQLAAEGYWDQVGEHYVPYPSRRPDDWGERWDELLKECGPR